MTAKLTNYDDDKCMNIDETPTRPWKTRERVIFEKSDMSHVTWKEKVSRFRITFGPVVRSQKKTWNQILF